MKYILFILSLTILSFSLVNCEENTEKLNPDDLLGQKESTLEIEEPTSTAIPKPEFPIVATIDGTLINLVTQTGATRARNIDIGRASAVMFDASDNQTVSAATYNIALIFEREDLKLGENILSFGSGIGASTGVNVTDFSKAVPGGTVFVVDKGKLTVTQIDSIKGIIAGTFEIDLNETTDGFTPISTLKITNGKFYFTYEVK